MSLAACSAPAFDPDLVRGERAEREGRHSEALDAYAAVLTRCLEPTASPTRARACADAYLARAELLERMGRPADAALAYENAPQRFPEDDTTASTGIYRAGRLYLELGDDKHGYRLLWLTVTQYPDQLVAGDALAAVVRDGTRRNAKQLYQVLGQLLQPLSRTLVADNLLYALAELAEHEFSDNQAALAHYDKIALDYPNSPMRDDALWHGARLARLLNDAHGAIERLERLLATREVTFGPGSYFSVWLDNAQLELGRVLRDDTNDYRAALRAFALLPKHYPKSVLRDDALWETAVTWDRMDDARNTCKTLARLAAKWPDSKYRQRLAPALERARGCAKSATP